MAPPGLDPAPPWAFRRAIGSVDLLVSLAGELGLPAEACLAESGIAPGQLGDAFAEVEAAQELAVVRNLVRGLGDRPGLGLEAGARYRLTTYGIWGYVVLSSPTIRKALEVGLRYLDLTFAFARFELEEAPGELRMLLRDEAIPADVRRFLVERDAAAAVALQRDIFARAVPLRRVELRFPRPAHAERFDAFFPGPVVFDRPENRLVFDAAWGDRPLPQANPHTLHLCETQCQELLAQRRARTGFSERVRHQLLRPGARFEAGPVAAALGVAPRTLRRHLSAEGASFQRLVDEVRGTLADEMLRRGMTVEEIAERLGYAEGASFIHAFKRWRGTTPGAQRARRDRAGA